MDIRDCSGCIVFRRNEKNDLEYLLIRRAERGASWGFPKGGVEPNMSPRASAAKEVREEAGVLCTPREKLGHYRFVKQESLQEVQVFVASYDTDSAEWEEEEIRKEMAAFREGHEKSGPLSASIFDGGPPQRNPRLL